MPRGVAIPELHEQLFQAVERVLEREGPSGLSGRAVTREAGVATGLLNNHFADLDDLLAMFILDRARAFVEHVEALSSRVGVGTVVGNLTEAGTAMAPAMTRMFNLVISRPSIAGRLQMSAHHGGEVSLLDLERGFATYIEAEKREGRVASRTDAPALAIALTGAVHHLLITGRMSMMGPVVAAILEGAEAGSKRDLFPP
jgi:AcrR family transcriptional regulator